MHVATTRGGTRICIDTQGNLWVGESIVTAPTAADGLREVFTDTPVALDGSRIALFEARGGVQLRRLTRGGVVTWDVAGTLCTPSDIDAVRKLRRQLAVVPAAGSPAGATPGREGGK